MDTTTATAPSSSITTTTSITKLTGTLGHGDTVKKGQYAEKTMSFDQTALDQFAVLVGDPNPLHTIYAGDYAVGGRGGGGADASKTMPPRPVVHGMLVASSLFSAIFGTKLPGAMYRDQNMKFLHPVRVGDRIIGRVEVTKTHLLKEGVIGRQNEYINHKNQPTTVVAAYCDTTVRSADNEKIIYIRGKAVVWVPIV
jgi:acyl dehydratase